jgi:hypothetical protein
MTTSDGMGWPRTRGGGRRLGSVAMAQAFGGSFVVGVDVSAALFLGQRASAKLDTGFIAQCCNRGSQRFSQGRWVGLLCLLRCAALLGLLAMVTKWRRVARSARHPPHR